MQKIMMIYAIPKGNDATRITFNRKLLNYNLQSHRGRYVRKSTGILSDYQKPTRSCIIFDMQFLEKVEELCKSMKIDATFYQIKKI